MLTKTRPKHADNKIIPNPRAEELATVKILLLLVQWLVVVVATYISSTEDLISEIYYWI